jgi:hypothetical protein
MNLSEDVDLEDYVNRPDKVSAAEISAIAQGKGTMSLCMPIRCPVCALYGDDHVHDVIFRRGWYASCAQESIRGVAKGL